MPEQFIYPNWHVAFLHFPIGLLGVGVVLEWLSYIWPRSAMRAGARWMILMGALLAIPTAALGVYAYRDVVTPTGSIGLDWTQAVGQSHWSAVQWRYMDRHIWLESIGTGLAVLAVVIWLACSDRARSTLHGAGLLLLTVALALMMVGGWYSGEAVYRHGTAVAAAAPMAAKGDTPVTAQPPDRTTESEVLPATAPAEPVDAHEARDREQKPRPSMHPTWVMKYIPPMQLHLLMAGATIAFAMAAIGVSIRRWSQAADLLTASAIPPVYAVRAGQPVIPEYAASPGSPIAPAPPVLAPTITVLPVFPARFWLAAFVFGLLTALGGAWMTGDWMLDAFIKPLQREGTDWSTNRLFWHVAFGLTIVLSTLLLGITTRVSRRAKFFTLLFVFVLVLAVAAQVWLGILMLFDSPHGPVTCFAC